jgi:hypothetical protein
LTRIRRWSAIDVRRAGLASWRWLADRVDRCGPANGFDRQATAPDSLW